MKKCILLLLLMVSCGLEEVSRRPDRGAGDIWVRPGVNVDSVAAGKTVLYVAAMEYAEWYNWRTDILKGSVKCSLVVYSNGIPMMKIPVGDQYETSSDPDTHRIVNGYLYTDYSSDNETIIKKNGEEIIRYSAREWICDLAECDGNVYTLGHSRDSEGFSYRCNGEVILERKDGSSFGRLHLGDDGVGFAFRESISGTGTERYYYAIDGEVSQVALREDIKTVWDIVPYKGDVCYLASVIGVSSPVLFTVDGMQSIAMMDSSSLLTGSIAVKGEILYLEGLIEKNGTIILNGMWQSDGKMDVFPAGLKVSSISIDKDRPYCVLNPSSSYRTGMIYRFGESFSMPQGYVAFGTSPSVVINGILYTGLSSLNGEVPLIWKDGETTPLKINGYITAVSTN